MTVQVPLPGLRFHHVGIACRDLERESSTLSSIGYSREGEDFVDPIQRISGRFLSGGGPRLELVVPLDDTPGVLTNLLAAGHKMYHLAYETADFYRAVAAATAQRAKLVVEPVPATAFGGRLIAFLFLRNMMLVELIQSSADEAARL